MKKTILIIVMAALCLFFKANAQNPLNIYGKVLDSATSRPLEGATIKIIFGALTITNKQGEFHLQSSSNSGTLEVSYQGYHPFQTAFNETQKWPILISLSLNTSVLHEVNIVSTGYQTLPKERATGSFAQVDNELLNRRVSTNVIDRLEGTVPGLIFNHNTVASATGFDINIRGHSTIFANDQPLIVVDNFPYDGDINNINPNDVESVTVLKDAAASSIWGVKSGNGVIVITTKHGSRNGKMIVEINSSVTVGEKPNLFYGSNFLDANNFIDVEESLYKQGYYTNDLANSSHPIVSPVVAILNANLSQNEKDNQINPLRALDYRNQLGPYFYRKSVNQQYDVNLRGGGAIDDYFLSAGYDNNQGNQVGNGNQRITLNTRYNFSPNKKLDFSLGVNFIQTLSSNNSPLGNLTSYKSLYPYAQFADASGHPLSIAKDYASSYTDLAVQNGFLDWTFRPLDELRNADNTTKTTDNRINFGIKYKAFTGLSVDLKYQYEKSNTLTESYSGQATYYTRNLINEYTQGTNGSFTYPIPIGGTDDQQYQYLTSQRLRLQSNYNKAWSNNEFNAIAGTEISDLTTSNNGNTVYGYDKNTGAFTMVNFADYFQTNPSGNSSKIPSVLAFRSLSDRYVSYFGNAAYTYKKRYGFSLSGRIDKSNLFGVNTNQKSVPLYSVGGSWRFSDEKFYHLTWLPLAKLRLTYGYNGNVDKTLTAVTTIRQNTNSYITGTPYANVANPGNPDLRWEKITMLNMALDFSAKNDIISGSIEYYIKKGVDIIGDSPLQPSTGFSKFRGNTANTAGRGFDLVLNSINLNNQNFKWTTNFLLSYASDKVTRYDFPQSTQNALIFGNGNNGYILPIVNASLFGIYSYKWAGLDPANGNPRGYLNGKPSEDYASIIANTPLDSLKFSGTSRPKYFGSFRNTFSYKNFSLSANIIYKLDYFFKRASISYADLYQKWIGNNDYTKRWQKPGDELITNVPSSPAFPLDNSRDYFYANSLALITPGDHIRLQDMTLSYDFNKNSISRTPFKRIQIYCYANNLGILWRANKQGLDPDLFGSGLPIPLTISFGIKTQL
jgi:TonB-linked SusC/RagA family outer membrane protein